MRFGTRWQWTCAVLAACACACSSGKSVTKPDAEIANGSSWGVLHQKAQGNEQVTEYDTNHDGKTDVWQYTVKAKAADGREHNRLTRKELDLNGEGRWDTSLHYGVEGEVEGGALELD